MKLQLNSDIKLLSGNLLVRVIDSEGNERLLEIWNFELPTGKLIEKVAKQLNMTPETLFQSNLSLITYEL